MNKQLSAKEIIARRVAKMLNHGDIVNLGIGTPTMVANYVDPELQVIFQSENGMTGVGPAPAQNKVDKDTTNAGNQYVTVLPGGAFFDSALSFAIIRGGHVDVTVLGALEVAENGDLANWMVPGKMVPGMGGAMDLVVGAKKVIIAMEHLNKNGNPKILKKCTLPLTAQQEVDIIVTEMGVMEVTPEGIVLQEVAPGLSPEDVQKATEATLIIADDLKEMTI